MTSLGEFLKKWLLPAAMFLLATTPSAIAYYRVGAFKGQAVEHTERVHIDTGWVVVTNKNIYFAGPIKSVRLPYAKIVSFEPFSDGSHFGVELGSSRELSRRTK